MVQLLGIPLWSIGLYALAGLIITFITYTVVIRLSRTSSGETNIAKQDVTEAQQEISPQEEKAKEIVPPPSQEVNKDAQLIDQKATEATPLTIESSQAINLVMKDISSVDTQIEKSPQTKCDELRADLQRISVALEQISVAVERLTADFAVTGANIAEQRVISAVMDARLTWLEALVAQEVARRNAQNSNQPPQANISGVSISPQDPIREHKQ
jgi:hypothetical protein